jgi:hypothetical protein
MWNSPAVLGISYDAGEELQTPSCTRAASMGLSERNSGDLADSQTLADDLLSWLVSEGT